MAKKKATRRGARRARTSRSKTAPETETPASTGRPAGSENRRYDYVEGLATRCRKCGSTDRTRYEQTREMALAGTTRDGDPFTHVIWRRTCCRACGQWRIDRFFENRRNVDDAS